MLIKTITILTFIILVIPLLNLQPIFAPPDWGKAVTFRLIFATILLCFTVYALKNPSTVSQKIKFLRPIKLPLFILTSLIVVLFLSSLLAADPNFAFWGNPMRGGGFITFALLVLWAVFLPLVLTPKNWKTAWTVTYSTTAIVSAIAIFQWQGWLSNIFIEKSTRPMSTMGNDIQLGMYLLLFIFPAMAWFYSAKTAIKKIAYGALILLMLFVIFLTGSRGAYLGIALGLFFFMVFFPWKKLWQSLAMKLAFFLIILIPLSFLYLVNVRSENIYKLSITHPEIAPFLDRFNLTQIITQEPRFSAWLVGINAIKEKPVIGWGMEHFALAFDTHYNPQLPNIQYIAASSNSWWDRAHNILIDMGVQGGILGLSLYLALFTLLFWQLQKIKRKTPQYTFEAHALQSTFVAYLGAVLFGFDTFSTYFVLFVIIGYALYLIVQSSQQEEKQSEQKHASTSSLTWSKIAALGILCMLYVIFAWHFNLKPLFANAEINAATHFTQNPKTVVAGVLHGEKALKQSEGTFLAGYASAKYFDALRLVPEIPGLTQFQLAKKYYSLMQEAARLWPYHTRNWIFLGQLADFLAERGQNIQPTKENPNAKPISREEIDALLKTSHEAFAKAAKISPKHQEIFIEWARTYFIEKDYEGAKAKAQECIDIDPRTGDCWFLKGVAEEFLGERKQSERNIFIAKQKKFDQDENDISAFSLLIKAYIASNNTKKLVATYEKLITLKPNDVQIRASLATGYAQIGDYRRAREQALEIIKLFPETKSEAEEFLKTLP